MKRSILRKITAIAIMATMIFSVNVFAFADGISMGNEGNQVESVELNSDSLVSEGDQILNQLRPAKLGRAQLTPTVNPDAMDAAYEDNDWVDFAANWAVFNEFTPALFGVLDNTNKEVNSGMTRGIDIDFYRFTVYPSSGLNGSVGIRLSNPISGYETISEDYDLYLYREDIAGVSFTSLDNTTNVGSLLNKTVITPAITQATTYVVGVVDHNLAPSDKGAVYALRMVNPWTSTHRQFSFSPSSLTSTGGGSMSGVASIDLTNNALIPDGAFLKSVTVTSTRNNSLGNSYLQIGNLTHGFWQETIYSNTATWSIYNDNFTIPVKAEWWLRYYSLALSTSTVSNPVLDIWYYINQYANE